MTTINMHDAKTRLSDLVARAEAGEEVVIARRNKPAVRLVPVEIADGRPTRREAGPQPAGFAEDRQAEYDVNALRQALDGRREFTIMRDGKAVAKVVPVETRERRKPGRFAYLRGKLPPGLFEQALSEDELAAWEGTYSAGDAR